MKKETITFRISVEHKAALQRIADANKRTLGDVLRLLIEEWLNVGRMVQTEGETKQ